MTRKIRVAAAQLGPNEGKGYILERIYDLLNRAHAEKVELVVFPELALTPYFARWKPNSSLLDQATEQEWETRVTELCKHFALDVVLPVARKLDGSSLLLNSSAVIDHEGRLLGYYDKLHLPHTIAASEFAIYERDWFAPGESLPSFELGFGTLGTQICYDRHFPEGFSSLSSRGADVIALSSNSPLYGSQASWRRQAWLNLCRVRAADNGVAIVASCKAGTEFGWDYIGHSCVVDPQGNVVAMAETSGDELVVATLGIEERAEERLASFASSTS